MSFERCVEWTLAKEGGDAHHPADRGKATRFGISSAAHPDVDLATLTREGAIALYRERYWAKIQGDALPWPLCLVIFDHAVHAGVLAAVRALQRRLGFSHEDMDGVLGPQTLRAARDCPQSSLVRCLLHDRMRALVHQGSTHSQRVFLPGWTARVLDLALEV